MTDKKSTDPTWDTQADWEAYQSKTDTQIENGNVQLYPYYLNFENGLGNFQGDTGDFFTTTDASVNGDYSVERSGNDQNHRGIWYNSAQFSTPVTVWLAIRTGADTSYRGGGLLVNSNGDGYVAYVDPAHGLSIVTATAGRYDSRISSSVSIGTDTIQFYTLELNHDGADGISATLHNFNGSDHTVSVTDSTYTPDRTGAQCYDNGYRADFFRPQEPLP